MADDIVPALLEVIQTEFDEQTAKDPKLIAAVKALQAKKATYLDVNDFAITVGQILGKVLGKHITGESLPDGKMYFNIAQRLLDPTMKKNHDLISSYALDVQNGLNQQAGLHLRGQTAPVNQSRIDGIVNRVSQEDDFEKVKWLLEDPLINFSQSVVDDTIKANAEFQAKAGLHPKITRRVAGHACDWCKSLAGTYDYQDEPNDIYRRHERCRCTVDYKPGDGRQQNVWSKAWKDPQKDAKIETRKTLGLLTPNYTGQSGVSAKKRGRVHPQALPNWQNAFIDKNKFENYFLNLTHVEGAAKAKELANVLGLTPKNYQMVISQIRTQLPYYKAVQSYKDKWGKRYVVMMPVTGPNGASTLLLTFWIDEGKNQVRFTNAFRAHKKDRRKYK